MNPDIRDFVEAVVGFIVIAATGLTAVKIWLQERRRTLPGADHVEIAQLKEHLEQHAAGLEEAQSALASQAAQIAELQERVDFAERLLAQARDRAVLGTGQKRE
jgi:hypothetical protein